VCNDQRNQGNAIETNLGWDEWRISWPVLVAQPPAGGFLHFLQPVIKYLLQQVAANGFDTFRRETKVIFSESPLRAAVLFLGQKDGDGLDCGMNTGSGSWIL